MEDIHNYIYSTNVYLLHYTIQIKNIKSILSNLLQTPINNSVKDMPITNHKTRNFT